jgi:hypothetical protein
MMGWVRMLALAAPVLLLCLAAGGVQGQESKSPTDEVVRTEMSAIRNLTLNAHTLVTHRRMPPADARTFHARVKAAVERLRTGTTLDGGARDEIESLTGSILAGAAAVGGGETSATTPIDGIIAIDEALALYAKEFDHPGWQPLR